MAHIVLLGSAAVSQVCQKLLMAYIPHPPIFVSEIRTTDIWLLLAVGATWELLTRIVVLTLQIKPASLLKQEQALDVLQQETDHKRKMGPSAFVETSKLERQVLALEKDINTVKERRQKSLARIQKGTIWYGNILLSLLVFCLYYGVPLLTVEDLQVGVESDPNKSYLKAILFPVASVGMGMRISKWGMPLEIQASSIGGLVVLWCGQVVVGKLMDAVDAVLI